MTTPCFLGQGGPRRSERRFGVLRVGMLLRHGEIREDTELADLFLIKK